MKGNNLWKAVITLALLTWAILKIVPWTDTPFADYVRQEASAEQADLEALLSRMSNLNKENPKEYSSVFVALKKVSTREAIDLTRFFPHIDLSDQKNLQKRNDILLRELLRRSQGKLKLGLDLKGGVSVTFKVHDEGLSEDQYERAEQIDKARTIIQERVDGLGVAEPVIRLKEGNRIEVQMPGINTRDNPDVLQQIGAPALLEFSLVHRTANPATTPEAPLGYIRMIQEVEMPNGEIVERPEYVKKIPVTTGEIISQAFAAPNEFGGYKILLRFTKEGERKFADVTRAIAEENERSGTLGQLAIILDGKLYSAPTVREEIRGGAEITGRFSQREAIELANVLNNPLEVGLDVEALNEVSPTLAVDARNASLTASLLASLFVLVFMVAIYQLAGLVAVFALVCNVVLVLGTLSSFGGTLSLPGVAGLVLTIGMGVDANILIFERMREELRAGKSLHAALVAGHDKAFSAILDSNLTTIVAALILVWLGTGPVKGFGVTLAIGIVANIFSVLVVAQLLLNLIVESGSVKRLFSLRSFELGEIPFLNYRKGAFITAGACLLIGVVSVAFSHKTMFGIDFTGGDEIVLSFEQRLSSAEVEQVAQRSNIPEAIVNFQSALGQNQENLVIQTEPGDGVKLFDALRAAYPQAGLEFVGESQIGPSVGREVQINAVWAVLAALAAMLLYVAVRFEFGYGLGAVLSLVCVLLMSLGLYVFWGIVVGVGSGQFTAPMVAAVLMVLGYAINDTIVVFDRVREELAISPGLTLARLINRSISLTLSRTLLTGTTTIVATLILIFFGASIIVDFSLVFLLGVLTGTFSSIFIASPIFYWYHKGDRRKVEEGHILPTYDWTTGAKSETAGKSA